MDIEVKPERHEKQQAPLGQLQIAGQAQLTIPLAQRYDIWPYQTHTGTQPTYTISDSQKPVYRFNVLVAVEWEPSDEERQMLSQAFIAAALFLYNVTDGCMTFGQVVIGGTELMGCADIQIMASNRFNPRSWVEALKNPIKYTPIRVGRGLWSKNERTVLDWDQKKSYQTLIHEWAHYALGLKDEYLKPQPVAVPHSCGSNLQSSYLLVDKLQTGEYELEESPAGNDYTVIIPTISIINGTLMSSVEAPEFVPVNAADKAIRHQRVWDKIKQSYPQVQPGAQTDFTPIDFPPTLGNPAIFFILSSESAAQCVPQLTLEPWSGKQHDSLAQGPALLLQVPDNIVAEHCWVYVVKGEPATPQQIVAQGTFDAAAASAGLKLLNAEVADWLVLVGSGANGKQFVLQGQIARVEPRKQKGQAAAIVAWTDVTPDPFPIVDVMALQCQPDEVISKIQVRIGSAAEPTDAWIFSPGQKIGSHRLAKDSSTAGSWIAQECAVASLDGHVLMRWSDGKLAICTFSQGGGPATHVAAMYSPITAGSSEGNIMIFFNNSDQSLSYSNVRIVTTLIHGNLGKPPVNAEPRSYLFSITSSAKLPVELAPTLIMYFDTAASRNGGDLLIHRMDEYGAWQPMPTYVPHGKDLSLAAMPMDSETAKALSVLSGPRIEHYRLFWVPRDAPSGTIGQAESMSVL